MSGFITLDLPALLAVWLVALMAAALGNYLLLSRRALLGDAMAHAVLPGLVLAFLVTATRAPWAMTMGAIVTALFAAGLIEYLRQHTRLAAQTILGIVFTSLFAFGVWLLEQSHLRQLDLDLDCVLSGQIESLTWLAAPSLAGLPPEIFWLTGLALCLGTILTLAQKRLALVIFAPEAASIAGSARGWMLFLTAATALLAVAAFTVVGSILLIALLICPAASARLLTHKLGTQIKLSLLLASLAVWLGYGCAVWLPSLLGFDHSLSASGMIAVISGVILLTIGWLDPAQMRKRP